MADKFAITGDPQSGKTEKIAEEAKKILKIMKIILITRNSISDERATKQKLLNFGVNVNDNAENWKLNNINSLYVVKWNVSSLKKITKHCVNQEYAIFVDESDSLRYKSESEAGPVYGLSEELIENASKIVEISATITDVIIGNPDLKASNIIQVEPKKNFVPIEDYQMIPYKNVNTISILEDIYKEGVYKTTNSKTGKSIVHPRIVLNRGSVRKLKHISLLKDISNNTLINNDSVVIIEDSDGFRLYGKTLPDNFEIESGIKIKGKNGFYERFKFSKNSTRGIQDILQYLQDNGTYILVVIITGCQADRCKSYVSSNNNWHITDLIIEGNSMYKNGADLIQLCARLSHNAICKTQSKIYGEFGLLEDLEKNQKIIRKNMEVLSNASNNECAAEIIKSIKINKKELPKKPLCRSKNHKYFNDEIIKRKYDIFKYKYIDLFNYERNEITREFWGFLCLYNILCNKDKKIVKFSNVIDELRKELNKKYNNEYKSNDQVHGMLWTPQKKRLTSGKIYSSNKPEYRKYNIIYWQESREIYIRVL